LPRVFAAGLAARPASLPRGFAAGLTARPALRPSVFAAGTPIPRRPLSATSGGPSTPGSPARLIHH
jgi:hypothetical protein